MNKETIAKKYYEEGFNCCQAVVVAFADEMGMDKDALLRLASSFGGGMGGLGEVCGAASGMFMVLGALKGTDSTSAPGEKQLHYARIRELAKQFEEKHGSLLCRDLKSPSTGRVSCGDLVASATSLTEEYLEKQK